MDFIYNESNKAPNLDISKSNSESNSNLDSDSNSDSDSDFDMSKKELDKDKLNNKLLDRLTSEISIRKNKNTDYKTNENDLIPPFADGISNNFAPFDIYKKSKIKNFNN